MVLKAWNYHSEPETDSACLHPKLNLKPEAAFAFYKCFSNLDCDCFTVWMALRLYPRGRVLQLFNGPNHSHLIHWNGFWTPNSSNQTIRCSIQHNSKHLDHEIQQSSGKSFVEKERHDGKLFLSLSSFNSLYFREFGPYKATFFLSLLVWPNH